MSRRIVLVVCAVAAFAVAKPLPAQHYQSNAVANAFVVDPARAESGRVVFASRGCIGCHTVGKGELSAPDLGGLFERRSVDWVKKWLRDPPAMLATDDTAKELLKQYKNFRMPNLRL